MQKTKGRKWTYWLSAAEAVYQEGIAVIEDTSIGTKSQRVAMIAAVRMDTQ